MAKQCLQAMDASAGTMITMAACHMLATIKPAGAIEALLGYLPYSEDESVAEEIANTLNEIALRDGKPDPSLIKVRWKTPSLSDEHMPRQFSPKSAAWSLRSNVRKLLQDAKPTGAPVHRSGLDSV